MSVNGSRLAILCHSVNNVIKSAHSHLRILRIASTPELGLPDVLQLPDGTASHSSNSARRAENENENEGERGETRNDEDRESLALCYFEIERRHMNGPNFAQKRASPHVKRLQSRGSFETQSSNRGAGSSLSPFFS